MTDTTIIIPHRNRQERRAVWNKDSHTLTFERLEGKTWKPDYTKHDAELTSDYFQTFYGWPQQDGAHPTEPEKKYAFGVEVFPSGRIVGE